MNKCFCYFKKKKKKKNGTYEGRKKNLENREHLNAQVARAFRRSDRTLTNANSPAANWQSALTIRRCFRPAKPLYAAD